MGKLFLQLFLQIFLAFLKSPHPQWIISRIFFVIVAF